MFVPRARARSVLKKYPKLDGALGKLIPHVLEVEGGAKAEQKAKLMIL